MLEIVQEAPQVREVEEWRGDLDRQAESTSFLFWVPRFLFFSQSSGISFSCVCFSSVIVRNFPALLLKPVILVKNILFIFFYPPFIPLFLSSRLLFSLLIWPQKTCDVFSTTYTVRHCGKKTKTKRFGVGPWKEWIGVQGNEGHRRFEKTLLCCFPRAHDFPPRMRKQKGLMGHPSQGKGQCNILVRKDEELIGFYIYPHYKLLQIEARQERTHVCHIKSGLTLPGTTKWLKTDSRLFLPLKWRWILLMTPICLQLWETGRMNHPAVKSDPYY